jgi:hypothetical protein
MDKGENNGKLIKKVSEMQIAQKKAKRVRGINNDLYLTNLLKSEWGAAWFSDQNNDPSLIVKWFCTQGVGILYL